MKRWSRLKVAILAGGMLTAVLPITTLASPASAANCTVSVNVSDPYHYTLGQNVIGWFAGYDESGNCGSHTPSTHLEKQKCYTKYYCQWLWVGQWTDAKDVGNHTWQYYQMPWAGSGKYRAVMKYDINQPLNSVGTNL